MVDKRFTRQAKDQVSSGSQDVASALEDIRLIPSQPQDLWTNRLARKTIPGYLKD